ncbi:MAG TPA: DUF4301 family protein [Phaeodactylibacter sp.]|nr:DUF4301 family protein [Phaeodactylibacter sp.]
MFSEKDLAQIKAKGISLAQLAQQIKNFEEGFPFMQLAKAATVGDGLLTFDQKEVDDYVKLYEAEMSKYQIFKFVPASGAASRMFKSLFAFMEKYDGSEAALRAMEADDSFGSVFYFFKNIKRFAFYDDLQNVIAKVGESLESLLAKKEYQQVLRYLLTSSGLNYGSLPKGLLKFHRYEKTTRTPLEEHLVEGVNYCKDKDGNIDIHFTVSPEHKALFRQKVREAGQDFANKYESYFNVYFSEQQPYTDTIAVDLNNQPFRKEDGSILFRPAGHGALLENLNTLDADIVFIKNIDNVVPDQLKPSTFRHKKLLAGVLIKNQKRLFDYAKKLEKVENVSEGLINEIADFLQKEISNDFTERFQKMHIREKASFLLQKLNRPIRVCGMVKNEGEPGGGPFWAKNADGTFSLHIVEGSQVDMSDADQANILQKSSHFNPVDLVCGLKDARGKKYNLPDFRDPKTGFVTMKSQGGRELKAQELPGLWNGAMADWNTIFVEVPIDTFNPVKIVNDLLREQHQ